jgi:hypothetical protein
MQLSPTLSSIQPEIRMGRIGPSPRFQIMFKLSNVVLAAAGAALIAIGIGAQAGAFSHPGKSSFHMPAAGSGLTSVPKQNDPAPAPPPAAAPAPPEVTSPTSPVMPAIVQRGGDDDGDD